MTAPVRARKIIHVDMDAFFASVEQRDRPEWRGKPLIVGGDPFGRGVVSTASYEARRYGIRSAMPAAEARRLCPRAIFVRPDFRRYEEASRAVRAVLRQHTHLVEPVSLDEAYLDVTEHRLGLDDPVAVARLIKQNIRAVTRLTASAGVAPNPFLAKVASGLHKPDGLTVVRAARAEDFLRDLPVRKIPGVGPVTEAALHRLGFRTCGELLEADLRTLQAHFGKTGAFLYQRARGIDERPVVPERAPKQISAEETFERDTRDPAFMRQTLAAHAREVFAAAVREGMDGRTVVVKVKYHDFETVTRSRTLERPPRDWRELHETAVRLLERTEARRRPVRLLGVGLAGLRETFGTASGEVQRELF